MKKFFSLILVCSLVQSVFGLEYGYQEALFNADDYFQKDHFVVNNFYPEMKLTDFWDIYRRNVPVREEDLSNIIHLEMDAADWKSFMSHYL